MASPQCQTPLLKQCAGKLRRIPLRRLDMTCRMHLSRNASKSPQMSSLREPPFTSRPSGAAELYSKFDRPNLWAYRLKKPVVAVVVLKAQLDCPPPIAATGHFFSRRSLVRPLYLRPRKTAAAGCPH